MDRLYVIMGTPRDCMVLGLQAHDESSARRAIAWQKVGQFTGPYSICRYDVEQRNFASIETDERFAPHISPFTELAWNEFMDRLDPDLRVAGGFSIENAPQPRI